MGTVRYTTINGEIIAEKRNGVRSLYVPDRLGSTVALLDNTQAQTDTFSYWPYGEVNSRTGTTPTPFQFVGTAGYYTDSPSRDYVRSRTLNTQQGRWMTFDSVAGLLGPYLYAQASPICQTDSQRGDVNRANAPTFGNMDQAAIAWCKKYFRRGMDFEMCTCLVCKKVKGKLECTWGNVGGGGDDACNIPKGCPNGSGFVHTHPRQGNWPSAGFSRADRWYCNRRRWILYVCSLDGTVRRISPKPGAPGPQPPNEKAHEFGEGGTIKGHLKVE